MRGTRNNVSRPDLLQLEKLGYDDDAAALNVGFKQNCSYCLFFPTFIVSTNSRYVI